MLVGFAKLFYIEISVRFKLIQSFYSSLFQSGKVVWRNKSVCMICMMNPQWVKLYLILYTWSPRCCIKAKLCWPTVLNEHRTSLHLYHPDQFTFTGTKRWKTPLRSCKEEKRKGSVNEWMGSCFIASIDKWVAQVNLYWKEGVHNVG